MKITSRREGEEQQAATEINIKEQGKKRGEAIRRVQEFREETTYLTSD